MDIFLIWRPGVPRYSNSNQEWVFVGIASRLRRRERVRLTAIESDIRFLPASGWMATTENVTEFLLRNVLSRCTMIEAWNESRHFSIGSFIHSSERVMPCSRP